MSPAWMDATLLLALTGAGYVLGARKGKQMAGGGMPRPAALPQHYGAYVALWTFLAYIGASLIITAAARPDLMPRMLLAAGVALAAGHGTARALTPRFAARHTLDLYLEALLLLASFVSVLITLAILFSVLFEALRFLRMVPLTEFLFGLQWSPQLAMRADQAGGSGAFGAIPLFWGTLLITAIAMLIAVPVGLMSAIYMVEYAAPSTRGVLKPVLEILAGIPTVVYGYFAILMVSPALRSIGEALGVSVASESALAAGVVMGVMIIPFISSLSDDIIAAVPSALRDASYGLGATKSETIRQVVLPAATPGIIGAFLLAVSRAIGETMIVVMAAGMAANMTFNPLDAVTTVTVQIVALLVGDQEFDSAKTLAAFALGLTLLLVTLALNVVALTIVRRYRRKYQ